MGFSEPLFGHIYLGSAAPSRTAKTTLVADKSCAVPVEKATPRLLCSLFSTAVFSHGPTLSLNSTFTETSPTRIERMRLASARPAMAARQDATFSGFGANCITYSLG